MASESKCPKCGAGVGDFHQDDRIIYNCGSMRYPEGSFGEDASCLRRQISQRDEDLREAKERVQRLTKDHKEPPMTLADEQILEEALDVGFMISTAYGQQEPKLMPVSDYATLLDFAKRILAAAPTCNGPDQPCRCAEMEGKLRRLAYMAHNTPATVDQANETAKEAMEILAEFKGEG